MNFDPEAARSWLRVLHGRRGPGGWMSIGWLLGDKFCSDHFPVGDVDQAVARIEQLHAEGHASIYARVTAVAERPAKRGGADDTLTLPAMWADLDYGTVGHLHELCPADCPKRHKHITRPLPADEIEARKIHANSGLPEPSYWIHSGGGLYPIWLLNPVPVVRDDLAAAKALARDWQDALDRSAKQLGLHYGTEVSDLARVLRVPGTVNRKDPAQPRPCHFLSVDGPTYTLEQLQTAVAAVTPVAAPASPSAPSNVGQVNQFMKTGNAYADSPRPGDLYNEASTPASVLALLESAGWAVVNEDAEKIYVKRPGKTTGGHSGTIDKTTCGFWVFSGDAHPFEANRDGDKGHRPFYVYAVLHHGGDMPAAGRALRQAGYVASGAAATPGQANGTTPGGGTANTTANEPVPSPSDPMRVARHLIPAWLYQDTLTLHSWRSTWMQWRRSHWVELDDTDVRAALYRRLEHARFWKEKTDGSKDLVPWAPTKVKMANLIDALGAITLLPSTIDAPSWSDLRDESNIVACSNGLLRLADRTLLNHDPRFFNLVAVPFPYDATAAAPSRWLAFLRDVWTDDHGQVDQASINALQEFFGYVVSGRTDLQKILLIIGPTRSGKGTIGRVLTALVGKGNMAGPTLAGLTTNFGLSPLLGKPLAIISDARLGGGSTQVVERLLTISGEDTIDVDRKNRDPWTGRLPTRFLILSNELPSFGDASGTIAHRFIVLSMQQSWLGREDIDLSNQLDKELPGILNWALDGLFRLVQQGRFTEPASSVEAVIAMKDSASPTSAFVRECCDLGAGHEITVDDVFNAWRTWCEDNGRDRPGTKQMFGRNLQAVVPQVRRVRPRDAFGNQVPTYQGIRIKPDLISLSRAESRHIPLRPLHNAGGNQAFTAPTSSNAHNGLSRDSARLSDPPAVTPVLLPQSAPMVPPVGCHRWLDGEDRHCGAVDGLVTFQVGQLCPEHQPERAPAPTSAPLVVADPNYCAPCGRPIPAAAFVPCDSCGARTHARGRGSHGPTCPTCIANRVPERTPA